jgi:hypothetical protein
MVWSVRGGMLVVPEDLPFETRISSPGSIEQRRSSASPRSIMCGGGRRRCSRVSGRSAEDGRGIHAVPAYGRRAPRSSAGDKQTWRGRPMARALLARRRVWAAAAIGRGSLCNHVTPTARAPARPWQWHACSGWQNSWGTRQKVDGHARQRCRAGRHHDALLHALTAAQAWPAARPAARDGSESPPASCRRPIGRPSFPLFVTSRRARVLTCAASTASRTYERNSPLRPTPEQQLSPATEWRRLLQR